MSRNLDLIEDYRNVITNTILDNDIIIDVLKNGNTDIESPDSMLWERIFPNEFNPEVITETESYIFYDIDETVNNVNAYTTLTLYFWVLTHKDIIKYNGDISTSKNRLRNDIIVRELKKTFAPENNLGISKNKLVYNKIYGQGNTKYTGRLVVFKITDFSDKIRYSYNGDK